MTKKYFVVSELESQHAFLTIYIIYYIFLCCNPQTALLSSIITNFLCL